MTAFEMASQLSRNNGGRNFTRDQIKVAHNAAVEALVSNRVRYLVSCIKTNFEITLLTILFISIASKAIQSRGNRVMFQRRISLRSG